MPCSSLDYALAVNHRLKSAVMMCIFSQINNASLVIMKMSACQEVSHLDTMIAIMQQSFGQVSAAVL